MLCRLLATVEGTAWICCFFMRDKEQKYFVTAVCILTDSIERRAAFSLGNNFLIR